MQSEGAMVTRRLLLGERFWVAPSFGRCRELLPLFTSTGVVYGVADPSVTGLPLVRRGVVT